MSKYSESFVVEPAAALVMVACCQVIANLGWRVLEQGDLRLVCKESRSFSFTNPTQIEITCSPSANGTMIWLKGSNFGLGPIQSGHVKSQVKNIRNQIEVALNNLKTSASSDQPIINFENDNKKCPMCAETIKLEAIKCRFCGHLFDFADIDKVKEERRKANELLEDKLKIGAECELKEPVKIPHNKFTSKSETKKPSAWTSTKLKTCKTCGKEISKNALTCPHCGEITWAGYWNTVGERFNNLGCLGIVAILLFGWFIYYVVTLPSSQDRKVAEKSVIESAPISNINYAEIRDFVLNDSQKLTDAQFKQIGRERFIGKRVQWKGSVNNILETWGGLFYELNITMEQNWLDAPNVKFTVPKDIALSFGKRQTIEFTGIIDSIQRVPFSLSCTIYLKPAEVVSENMKTSSTLTNEDRNQEKPVKSTFNKAKDGGITDSSTGLEWYVGPDIDTNQSEAESWTGSINPDGGAWRMPTIEELKTLYQPRAGRLNMDPVFKITGNAVWSNASNRTGADVFSFSKGQEFHNDWDCAKGMRAFAVSSIKGIPPVPQPVVLQGEGKPFIDYIKNRKPRKAEINSVRKLIKNATKPEMIKGKIEWITGYGGYVIMLYPQRYPLILLNQNYEVLQPLEDKSVNIEGLVNSNMKFNPDPNGLDEPQTGCILVRYLNGKQYSGKMVPKY